MANQKTQALKQKLIVIAGNPAEIGSNLQALYDLNPDIIVIDKYVTQSIRPVNSSILQSGPQQQYEPISVIYIIYVMPKDAELITTYPDQAPAQVKANLKHVTN